MITRSTPARCGSGDSLFKIFNSLFRLAMIRLYFHQTIVEGVDLSIQLPNIAFDFRQL